jgi:hypothetical protein
MNANLHRLLLVTLLLFLVSSCASDLITDSAYEPLTRDAIRYFAELRQSGKLPGVARDEHGRVESEVIPQRDRVSYPVTVGLRTTSEADHSRYSYTFTKDTSSSDWRLTKALRLRADGQHEELKLE